MPFDLENYKQYKKAQAKGEGEIQQVLTSMIVPCNFWSIAFILKSIDYRPSRPLPPFQKQRPHNLLYLYFRVVIWWKSTAAGTPTMRGLVRQIVGSNSRNLYRMGGTAISLSASQNGFYVLKLYTQNEASKEVGEEKLLGISFCLVLLYFCEFMKTYSTKKYSIVLWVSTYLWDYVIGSFKKDLTDLMWKNPRMTE